MYLGSTSQVKMKRLSKKQMVLFSVGQLGWSILGGIISAWLVTFFLPTKGDRIIGATQYLEPILVGGFLTIIGIITASSRIFDAVTDPLIASWSDRSKNPKGRRMPFMRWAAIPFAAVTVLLFCIDFGAYDASLGWLNILWVSVMIILFYLFMTMYCTPYNALISEFGKNQEDRMFISTSISFTYLFGTLFAYLPFILAGGSVTYNEAGEIVKYNPNLVTSLLGGNAEGISASQYAWSFRICFIVLAVIACVCMLLPAFLIKEKEYTEGKPSDENVFRSLVSTFKNKEFRTFAGSDIVYWVGLTMFQTGLPFFVKVSLGFDAGKVIIFMGGMSILSALFYPIVTKLVKKYGKKKLVIAGFIGLAACYAITAVASIPGFLPEENFANGLSWVFGVAIMVVSALPMALLGIIPQSIVADVAEAEAVTTGQNREGMFFAARTFAMKLGQSVAMLLFTSIAIAFGKVVELENYPSKLGMLIVAIIAVVFCAGGAVILAFYHEKKIMETIAKEGDEEFLHAVEENNKNK